MRSRNEGSIVFNAKALRHAARISVFVGLVGMPGHGIEVEWTDGLWLDDVELTSSGDGGTVPRGYVLAWSDEFNGVSIDSTKWVNGSYPWGGHVLSYGVDYTVAANATVSNGFLHLLVTSTDSGGMDYSGAVISGHGKKDFGFGYFEFRAKYEGTYGLWPGLWLNHDMAVYGEGHTHEIDVLEAWTTNPNRVHQAVHYFDANHYSREHDTDQADGFCDQWHVYGLKWTSTSIVWSIDGVQVWSTTPDQWWFPHGDARMNLILDHAAGGWNQGGPSDSMLPADFQIDYVRYYRPRRARRLSTLRR